MPAEEYSAKVFPGRVLSGTIREEFLEKFECHRKLIDIQVCIDGVEEFAWKPIKKYRMVIKVKI